MTNLRWSLLVGLFAALPACGGEAEGFSAAGSAGAAGAAGSAHAGQSSCPSAGAGGSAGAAGGSAAGGAAQGGGAAHGVGPFTSSFPDSAVIGDLPASDRSTLCAELQASPLLPAVLNEACLQAALFQVQAQQPTSDAEARTYCAIIYGACLQTDAGPPPCDDSAPCAATVGQLEQCTNDIIGVARATSAALPSCAGLTLDALSSATLSSELSEPASCVVLGQKCPNALGE